MAGVDTGIDTAVSEGPRRDGLPRALGHSHRHAADSQPPRRHPALANPSFADLPRRRISAKTLSSGRR
jgi:hypothetical protein